MKELLFLAHRIPYPPNKGDKIRSFHMLRHLAGRYRVHLATFVDDARDWAYLDEVKKLCAETCFVGLAPTRARLRSMAALAGGEPLTLRYYRDARMAAWVRALLASRPVQHGFVFCSAMAQYLDSAAGVRRVLDFVDLDSDKWRQYSRRRPWPLSWLYRREGDALFRRERHYASAFDASIFVSEAEARLFVQQAPELASRVTFVENGVDTEYFSPARPYPCPYRVEERVLAFTGTMDYWANVDAVVWFATEVFPSIRARVPAARFYIVGAKPTRAVTRLAALPGVHVTGMVTDVRPYLAHARAVVAPLRVARGVQNKVLEGLAMGRTVLMTPAAADGLRLDAKLRSFVCADAAEMAGRALAALAETAEEPELGSRGRQWVVRDYGWQRNLRRLEALIEGDAPPLRVASAQE